MYADMVNSNRPPGNLGRQAGYKRPPDAAILVPGIVVSGLIEK